MVQTWALVIRAQKASSFHKARNEIYMYMYKYIQQASRKLCWKMGVAFSIDNFLLERSHVHMICDCGEIFRSSSASWSGGTSLCKELVR